LEKAGNNFWTAQTRLPASLGCPEQRANGHCHRIVTISTAVCNKSSPAFACANFQAGIFSEPAMDGLVLLNCRVQI